MPSTHLSILWRIDKFRIRLRCLIFNQIFKYCIHERNQQYIIYLQYYYHLSYSYTLMKLTFFAHFVWKIIKPKGANMSVGAVSHTQLGVSYSSMHPLRLATFKTRAAKIELTFFLDWSVFCGCCLITKQCKNKETIIKIIVIWQESNPRLFQIYLNDLTTELISWGVGRSTDFPYHSLDPQSLFWKVFPLSLIIEVSWCLFARLIIIKAYHHRYLA